MTMVNGAKRGTPFFWFGFRVWSSISPNKIPDFKNAITDKVELDWVEKGCLCCAPLYSVFIFISIQSKFSSTFCCWSFQSIWFQKHKILSHLNEKKKWNKIIEKCFRRKIMARRTKWNWNDVRRGSFFFWSDDVNQWQFYRGWVSTFLNPFTASVHLGRQLNGTREICTWDMDLSTNDALHFCQIKNQ